MKKKTFYFQRPLDQEKDLLSHEEFSFDWLFNTIGNGNEVSAQEIW